MGMRKRLATGLCLGLTAAAAAPAVAGAQAGSDVWDPVSGALPATSGGSPADIQPDRFRAFTLDQSSLEAGLAAAPEGRAERARRDRLGRAHAARTGRRLPALRGLRVADHGARPRRQAPGHQDLRGSRRRRSDRHGARRHDAARLPRLRALAERHLVHRPVLPPRRQRLRQLLHAAICGKTRTARSSRARPTRDTDPLDLERRQGRRPGRRSCCGPTGSRWSPTPPTPPTSAARRTSPRPRSR